MTETTAYNWYAALNITGVGIGFYLSNVIELPNFAALFILIAASLYMYATSLKQMLLVGNLVVALLLSVSVLIIGIFDLYPMITPQNQALLGSLFSILLDYAIFCFMINFIREIVKDLEDIKGDYNQGMRTLAVVLGNKKTSRLVFVLSLIPVFSLLFYIYKYLFAYQLYVSVFYALALVLTPLMVFSVKTWSAETPKEWHQLSSLLKLILFFGIFSILILTLNIKYNA